MQFNEPVSHKVFMARALYDPKEGYYSTKAAVSKSGDFSTSATLSKSFAQAISNCAAKTAARLGLGAPYPIIELGPGDGSLARALSDLNPEHPLHLVETSPRLRAAQVLQLADRDFQHHDDLESALLDTGGIGIIIGNEFIDAFPATKLRWQDEDWHEVGVTYSDGSAQEILAPLAREIDADAPANPKEGETIYVHPSFHMWLQSNSTRLKQGAMLFIDYGAERPSRECRAYAGQQRFEGLDVYAEAGERDITCDINFTDLARWLNDFGFKCSPTSKQADFIKGHLPNFESLQAEDEALAFLTHPLGAGGAFQVLTAERSHREV